MLLTWNNYQECCLLTAISAPVYIRIRQPIHVDEEKNISLNSVSKSYQKQLWIFYKLFLYCSESFLLVAYSIVGEAIQLL